MGKLELKIEKKNPKKCSYGGAPQVQKLNYDHDSCVRLNLNSLRISRVLHNFYRREEVETVKKMAESKTFLKFTQKGS